MEQPDKNKWIDEAINSFEGSERAEPSAFLFGKIADRLSERTVKGRIIPLRTVSVAAACILLLVVLNILLLNKQNKTSDRSIQEVANYYQLTNTNPLYSL